MEKGKFKLPPSEKERTDSILKRAIAVEKGESTPSLTEEHPDGRKFFFPSMSCRGCRCSLESSLKMILY